MKPSSIYKNEIEHLPPGLSRAVLRVMQDHRGEKNSISKADLIANLNLLGFGVGDKYENFERQVRDAIAELVLDKTNSVMIYGSSGDGGYFVVANWDEYEKYSRPELSREAKLRQRNQAMQTKAKRLFSEQPALI